MSHAPLDTTLWPSVNGLAAPIVQSMKDNAKALRISVERLESGATIVDAGINHAGGLEVGRLVAEICMGGLGTVRLQHTPSRRWPFEICVHSSNPVLACLGSQYAGWSLNHGDFFALGSGPGRAIAVKEELYKELGYKDQCDSAVLVLEVDKIPPAEVVENVARDTGLSADKLTFILTPTRSLAGSFQVVARVLEVAMHKVHALQFDLNHIVDGVAAAPFAPPAKDFVTGMGRTNDAILYGGQVHLFVKGSDDDAKHLTEKLPAGTSPDYGKPFAEIFKAVKYDFYKIDPMLFAPAQVIVTNMDSGNTFRAGKIDEDLLDISFGG
ncbi:MAG: methenyltetrahydromethanopterin cyclohydrolase [Methylophilaceae bacterium]